MATKTHRGLTFARLYDQHTLRTVILRIAQEINAYYDSIKQQEGDLDLVVVCVLKGAFMFYADLVREITHPHRNDFVRIKSYSGLNSTGEVRVEGALRAEEFAGRSVLVVEDMHDTGTTLGQFIKLLHGLNPRRVDTAVLVRRPDRPVLIDLKFRGVECNDFIVGYGLDYEEFGRHLPEIYQKVG